MNAITETTNFQIENGVNMVANYVTQFNRFANKSAESILEMCKVVHEASLALTPSEFVTFCNTIHIDRKSATLSKMKTIGSRFVELSKHKDRLPNAWTTLYYIAKMSDARFEGAVLKNSIHPMITATTLKEIAPETFPVRVTKPIPKEVPAITTPVDLCTFMVKTDPLFEMDKIEAITKGLEELCAKYGCELQHPNRVEV